MIYIFGGRFFFKSCRKPRFTVLWNLEKLLNLLVTLNGVHIFSDVECKLTNLGLNGNQLTRVPRHLLETCPHLMHLNLGYNQISHLDDLVHIRGLKLKNLNTLILRNNPIRTLSYIGGSDTGNSVNTEDAWSSDHNQSESVTISKPNSDNEIRALDLEKVDPQSVLGGEMNHISIPNVFRPEVFPNLRELILSFCQLGGELEPFPALPLTTLEISMGLRTASILTPNVFKALRSLEWLALDHNTLHTIR